MIQLLKRCTVKVFGDHLDVIFVLVTIYNNLQGFPKIAGLKLIF